MDVRIEKYRKEVDMGRGRQLVVTGSTEAGSPNPRVGLMLLSDGRCLGSIILHEAKLTQVIEEIGKARAASKL